MAQGQRAGLACALQVEEAREGALAALAGAKAAQDRNGNFPDDRRLQRQEGVGAGSLAPNLALVAQGLEPHNGCLLLPASWALAATLRGDRYRLKLHIGLPSFGRFLDGQEPNFRLV